jgi:pSer/pThr/pTyr-binding forkhead associated (FHA) protein
MGVNMESKLKKEFIRDMKSSYMVLKGDSREQNYKNKMLSQYSIPGFLRIDIKSINNMELYYYDITNLNTLEETYDTRVFHFKDIKELLEGIFDAIDNGREYFLEPDDFILYPDCLYMKENTDNLKFCYYPGFRESIISQLSILFEYIMNKADYKEESAVLLIYALYKESREKNTTLYRLRDILKEAAPKDIKVKKLKAPQQIIENAAEDNILAKDKLISDINTVKQPAAEENGYQINLNGEYEKQEEVSYYETSTFIMGGAIVAGALGFLFVLFRTGVLSDELGHPDIIKVTAGLAIVICLSGYALTKVLDPKKKSTRLITKLVYEDVTEEPLRTDQTAYRQSEELTEASQILQEDNSVTIILSETEDKTEILFTQLSLPCHYLVEKNSCNPTEIPVETFPYYVGKDKNRNQLVLTEGSVSRLHAVITKRDNTVFLTDLGSTNGTYVNGQRLEKNQPVQVDNSDELAFSREIYLFKIKE